MSWIKVKIHGILSRLVSFNYLNFPYQNRNNSWQPCLYWYFIKV
jgi:hypothetical protein